MQSILSRCPTHTLGRHLSSAALHAYRHRRTSGERAAAVAVAAGLVRLHTATHRNICIPSPAPPASCIALTRRGNSINSSKGYSTLGNRSGGIPRAKLAPQAKSVAMDVDAPTTAAADAAQLLASMPKAIVRIPPGADSLVVTLTLGAKTCNLNRPTDELLDKALTRLAKNLVAKPSKKDKRKKGGPPGGGGEVSGADTSTDDPGGPTAVLFEDVEGRCPLDRSLPNGVAWVRGAVLEVAGERFKVVLNPPSVDKLYIERLAMVGYPTAAAVTLSHADPAASRWRWSAQRPGETVWRDLDCTTQYYTPRPEDEGAVLRVECTPGGLAGGRQEVGDVWLRETVAGMTGPVQAGPTTSSAVIRGAATPSPLTTPGAFRILSYNILADQYAGSDYTQNVLFNYCPKECLDPGYRRPLVVRELLSYHADVLCLQEVDDRAFTDCLALHLGLQGFSGHYTNKQGKVREGSATFWRTARFTALAHHDIRLREAFARPLPPLHSQFEPLLTASPALATALQQVTTIAQATLLAPVVAGAGAEEPQAQQQQEEGDGAATDATHVGEGCLCVVNTHLFFHPYAPHIRTMHTAAILEETAAFLERCAADSSDPRMGAALRGRRPTVLFVGDLNSDLNDGIPGVVELLRRGRLPADFWDWAHGAAFKWGMGEEDAETMAQGTAAQVAAAAAAATASAATSTTKSKNVTTTSTANAPSPSPKPSTQPSSSAPGAPPSLATSTPSSPAASAAAGAGGEVSAAAAAAAAESLFVPDGHAFDSAAAAPHAPIPVTGIDLTAPFVLRSADDLATPYTNYTSGYKALLDYVWYEEADLRVLSAAPIPSETELGSFIPSPTFPSDHLAVVYDMQWRTAGESTPAQMT